MAFNFFQELEYFLSHKVKRFVTLQFSDLSYKGPRSPKNHLLLEAVLFLYASDDTTHYMFKITFEPYIYICFDITYLIFKISYSQSFRNF